MGRTGASRRAPISRGGALGPILTLSADGEDAHGAQIASDADGDAVAVWQRFDGTKLRAQARTISRAGALGATKNLSVAGKDAYGGPQVAIDAEGDAVAVWASTRDLQESLDFGLGGAIESRSISRTGSLGAITPLTSCDSGLPRSPNIASDADGDAVAIWTTLCASGGPDPDANHGVQARRIARSGELGPVALLHSGLQEEGLSGLQIASDADGDVVAVWRQSFFGACADASMVFARPISKAGVLGPTTGLSTVGPLCAFHSFDPQIASDADGDVVAAWEFEGFLNFEVGFVQGIRTSHGP